ncbi:MAG: hypothetical protein EOP04_29840 [Proteobacteria bacterium]|nr:MAG: hypothetical protein EOP04_29840 [Pseudomonadota bacterium]
MMRRMTFVVFAGLVSTALGCQQSMKSRGMEASRKIGVSYTVVAKDVSTLPRCDSGTQGMKAYLSSKDDFIKCDHFSWKGSQPGDTHGSFANRDPIRFYEWTDEKLNLRWLAPHKDEINQERVRADVCSKGFRLPTSEELRASANNGLFDGLKAHGGIGFDRAWTKEKSAFAGLAKGDFETLSGRQTKGLKAGVYCVGPA